MRWWEKDSVRFCQSCFRVMESDEDFGTERGGARNGDYCRQCFKDGEFTDPALTMERVLDYRAPEMANMIIDPGAGRELLRQWIASLKRWRAEP
ncbi:MAG: zinc ribbon domain-containing protein [Oscillospiraceae bacterium]|jgi:hypothetical protein|nr:zinc ribbon domain-containing protein [Oscillospiraceae bacterium]